jgi:hypothetical protein
MDGICSRCHSAYSFSGLQNGVNNMANILILDAFRARRVVEKLHGKAFSFLDSDERYAPQRAEHADMQARAARFSVGNAPGFLNSPILEPLRNQRVRGKAIQQIVGERMDDA